MGFTPFPYDIGSEALEETYRFLGEHSDIIAHHFDSGIPWPEALEGNEYHPNVLHEIERRVSHKKAGQRVYLAVTPISLWRNGLASYWGENEQMPLPEDWKDKDFDDPEVIKAYINHCSYMISRFKPDYMAYGIEVDLLAENYRRGYRKFRKMASKVYKTLKSEYPRLPIILTFALGDKGAFKSRRRFIKKLLRYSDYLAVSLYPFAWKVDGEEGNPNRLSASWLAKVKRLAPGKPFAVAETGFIAQNLIINKYGISIRGKKIWQARYVTLLLQECNKLQAEFVIWFVPIDYDLLWRKMKKIGVDEFFKTWRDSGLSNGKRRPRPSLGNWDAWLKLTKKKSDET